MGGGKSEVAHQLVDICRGGGGGDTSVGSHLRVSGEVTHLSHIFPEGILGTSFALTGNEGDDKGGGVCQCLVEPEPGRAPKTYESNTHRTKSMFQSQNQNLCQDLLQLGI